jgi:uncharacterized membrane protein
MEDATDMRRVRIGGVVLGLGGFLDGSLLHRILHWHDMLSTVLPGSPRVALTLADLRGASCH